MSENPRRLTCLRINDRLLPTDPPSPNAPKEDMPPTSIDLARFGFDNEFIAINGWEKALEFWKSFRSDHPPDIIVADVQFSGDDSSPLHYNEEHQLIPTGLTHLKPIASMARALGMPIGVSVHTGDPGYWKPLADKGDRMGLLAAAEIAELAAILGEDIPFDKLETPDERLNWCWKWLEDNAKVNFMPAFNIALQNYRKQLLNRSQNWDRNVPAGIQILAGDWVDLLKWCQQMENSRRTGITPGLRFILDDGREDFISLDSLFADTNKPVSELPDSCFRIQVRPSDQPDFEKLCKLDENNLPLVGEFIYSIGQGSMTQKVFKAKNVLEAHFPVNQQMVKKESLVKQVKKGDPLVRGLAVLFQILHIAN